jgi:hypothetical protein
VRDEPPEQVVPFSVSQPGLGESLARWAQGVRFRPDDMRSDELLRRAKRSYLPQWLVDGRVDGPWRADVGFDYQVASYQDRYTDGGGWQSHQVTEGRVRWEPRAGRIARRYENISAPALEDQSAVMASLGGFRTDERREYCPEDIAGAVVRIPTLEPEAAWGSAQAAFVRKAEEECQQAAGADHIRGFVVSPHFSDLNWTLLLLPAYVTWYEEGGRQWPVLVNGQTGQVSGTRRASARKANRLSVGLGVVAALMFLLGGLIALFGAVAPPVTVLGIIILVIGLLLGVAAPIPAISVWVHNRRDPEN